MQTKCRRNSEYHNLNSDPYETLKLNKLREWFIEECISFRLNSCVLPFYIIYEWLFSYLCVWLSAFLKRLFVEDVGYLLLQVKIR